MTKFKSHKIKWLLDIAEVIKLASKDQSTKIGGLIFDDNYTILSTGYNSFPRGINDDLQERQERPEKYFWMEHCERNTIYNAIRSHADIRNANMLLTCGIPCADCARAIIQSSIKCVICQLDVGHSVSKEGAALKWNESCAKSAIMLEEAGVEVRYFGQLIG